MDTIPKVLQNIIFNYVDGDIVNPVIENILKYSTVKRENDYMEVNWRNLSGNKNAIHILEKNIDRFYLHGLCNNENFIYIRDNDGKNLIENILEVGETHPYFKKIDWKQLSLNKNVSYINKKKTEPLNFVEKIIEKGEAHPYFNKINFNLIYENENIITNNDSKSNIINYIENILNDGKINPKFKYVNWSSLCTNKNIIYIKDRKTGKNFIEKIIEEGETHPYFCKIDFDYLTQNKNIDYYLSKNNIKFSGVGTMYLHEKMKVFGINITIDV